MALFAQLGITRPFISGATGKGKQTACFSNMQLRVQDFNAANFASPGLPFNFTVHAHNPSCKFGSN